MKKENKSIWIIFGVIIIVIIAIVVNMKGQHKQNVNIDVISNYLEIKISQNAKIEYKDEHDSWFGEGFTIMKITDDKLLYEIKNSPNWKEDSDVYTSRISKIKNVMNNTYNEISKIHNYYWIYKHNYRNDDDVKYIEQMGNEKIETCSYLIGIYDVDNNTLYYYHMDM